MASDKRPLAADSTTNISADPTNLPAASWTPRNCTVDSTPIVSADGATDGWLIREGVQNDLHSIGHYTSKTPDNLAYSVSAVVRKGPGATGRHVGLAVGSEQYSSGAWAQFDLEFGTVKGNGTWGNWTNSGTPSIRSLGNNWFEVKIENTVSNQDTSLFWRAEITSIDGNGTTAAFYPGDGASGVYVTDFCCYQNATAPVAPGVPTTSPPPPPAPPGSPPPAAPPPAAPPPTSGYTPAQLPGIVAWIDPSDQSTVTVTNGHLTALTEKIQGAPFHTNSDASALNYTTSGAPGGFPAADSPGTAEHMLWSDAAGPTGMSNIWWGTDGGYLAFVIRPRAQADRGYVLTKGRWWVTYNSFGDLDFITTWGGTWVGWKVNVAPNQTMIVEIEWSGDRAQNPTIRINGSAQSVISHADPVPAGTPLDDDSNQGIWLASSWTETGAVFNGFISTVILGNRIPAASDSQNLRSYLNDRFVLGLGASPPSSSSGPPVQLTGLAAFYDFSDATSVTLDGIYAATVVDKGSSSFSISEPAGTHNGLIFNPKGLNNAGALEGRETARRLATINGAPSQYNNIWSGGDGGYVAIVCRPRSGGITPPGWLVTKGRWWVNYNEFKVFDFVTTWFGTWVGWRTNAAWEFNGTAVVEVEWNGDLNTSPTIRINGSAQELVRHADPVAAGATLDDDSGDWLIVGNDEGNAHPFDGYIGAVVLGSRIPSSTESANLRQWALNRFVNNAAIPGPTPAPTAPPGTATEPKLGVFCGGFGNEQPYSDFTTWLGRQIDFAVVFAGRAGWSDFTGSVGWGKGQTPTTTHPVWWSQPIVADGGNLAAAANGDYDSYWDSVANDLANSPVRTIRLGWEMNGGWYPWGVNQVGSNTPEQYASAYRRFVDKFRQKASDWVFVWNPSFDQPTFEGSYPGDTYVDIIALDIYESTQYHPWDASTRWAHILDPGSGFAGLNWLVNFARAHNKPIAFPEYATNYNDGEFPKRMRYWMEQQGSTVVAQAWWNATDDFDGLLPDHATTQAAYYTAWGPNRIAWGSDLPAPPGPPPPPPAPPPVPPAFPPVPGAGPVPNPPEPPPWPGTHPSKKWQDLLADPQSEKTYLIEADYLDPDARDPANPDAPGIVYRLYLADRPYTTRPTDPDPNRFYDGRAINSFTFTRSLWSGNATIGGRTLPGYGAVTVANADGGLDFLAGCYLDGRASRILLGGPGFTYDELGTVFTGTMQGADFGDEELSFRLRSLDYVLDKPIQEVTYTGGGRFEGPDTMKGKKKPLLFGFCHHIEPVYLGIIDGFPTYQSNDGPISDIPNCYDMGMPLTRASGTNPAPGQYAVDTTVGIIRLGSQAVGRVTCDVAGALDSDGAWRVTAADIAAMIVTEIAPGTGINTAAISALNALNAGMVGYYTGTNDVTASQVVDAILDSIGAWWGYDRQGQFQVGRLDPPSDSPVMEFSPGETLTLQRRATVPPAWRVVLGYQRAWTVMTDNELASQVSDSLRLFVRDEWRTQEHTDNVTHIRSLLAEDVRFNALLDSATDADEECQRRLDIHKVQREVYVARFKTQPFYLELGQTVRVSDARFRLNTGKNFVIIGMTEDAAASTVELTLWG